MERTSTRRSIERTSTRKNIERTSTRRSTERTPTRRSIERTSIKKINSATEQKGDRDQYTHIRSATEINSATGIVHEGQCTTKCIDIITPSDTRDTNRAMRCDTHRRQYTQRHRAGVHKYNDAEQGYTKQ